MQSLKNGLRLSIAFDRILWYLPIINRSVADFPRTDRPEGMVIRMPYVVLWIDNYEYCRLISSTSSSYYRVNYEDCISTVVASFERESGECKLIWTYEQGWSPIHVVVALVARRQSAQHGRGLDFPLPLLWDLWHMSQLRTHMHLYTLVWMTLLLTLCAKNRMTHGGYTGLQTLQRQAPTIYKDKHLKGTQVPVRYRK